MSKTLQGMDVGKMAADGFGQIMNSMDFFKRAWSGLATPFTPTVNVQELDKRITDLRAVEQWLTLNQNLLRTTIQGLEIQRGTLSAINTMSESFGNALKPSEDSVAQTVARHAAAAAQKAVEPPAPEAAAPSPARLFGAFDWSPFGMPSSLLPGAHTATPVASAKVGADTPADIDAAPAVDAGSGADAGSDADLAAEDSVAPSTGGEAAGDAPSGAGPGGTGLADAGSAGTPPLPGMNPLAWWEMLQENFRQIAQAASSEYAAAASAASPTGQPAGKPAEGSGKGRSKRSTSAGAAAGSAAGKAADGSAPARRGRAQAGAAAPRGKSAPSSDGGTSGSGGSRTRRSRTRSDKEPE